MYDCEECQKSFSNKSNLNRHWKKRHGEEEWVEDIDYSEEETMEEADESEEEDEEKRSDEESTTMNIWELIVNESIYRERSITELYKEKVLFSKFLKKDDTHKSIMHTLKKAQEEEDMDFHEALNYAVDKRKFLIQRKMPVADDSSADED